MTPVLIGTALALVALAYVLYPLFRGEVLAHVPTPLRTPRDRTSTAVDALREIEFDRATGKLSDHDYETLKALYTQRAVQEMRSGDEASVVVCGACGARPEPDALFCSECGRQLTV